MILFPQDGALRVVTQCDHAHLAGEIAALWRADGLPENPRRAAILLAVREHDNGWRETDSAPRVDASSGRPHDFRTLPEEARRELWLRGTARLAPGRSDPPDRGYAALLIVHHALALHGNHQGEAAWDEDFLAPLDELYAELLEATGATAAEVAADYRFLNVADTVSLLACGAGTASMQGAEVAGHRVADGGGRVEVEPFPLAGVTTFRVPARWIPNRAYRGDADLGGELAAALWTRFEVRIVPGTGG